jgi:hypothetical protein
MRLRFAKLTLICSCLWLTVAAADDTTPTCPKPSKATQARCREVTYKDLPAGARALLRKLKCDVGSESPYDFGSAVDLNSDGSPEYQFCCHEAPHGPCSAVLIGKVGTEWKDLTAKEGLLGFEGACTGFVTLDGQHGGFHDVCLPNECSPLAKEGTCVPTIWHYDGDKYRVSDTAAPKPSKAK